MGHLGTRKVTVKNVSGGTLTVRGVRLLDNEEYTIPRSEIDAWDDSNKVEVLLDSGDLIVIENTSRRNWKKSITESTTTSTSWQRKLRLNMDITTSGTYRMAWTGDISSSANNQEVASRVQVDDSTPNYDFNQSKGKDIVSVAGFHYAVLTSGSHTLDLDWKAVAGGTAKIEKARLEYWAESVEEEEI